MKQDKRHIPQGRDEARNAHTRPAESGDVDKLRENPHNDERVIRQGQPESEGSNPDLRSGSTFARKDEEGNQVINQEEQEQVVNPMERSWESKSDKEQPETPSTPQPPRTPEEPHKPESPEIPGMPDSPDMPTTNPYEELGDDPDVANRKIPKF